MTHAPATRVSLALIAGLLICGLCSCVGSSSTSSASAVDRITNAEATFNSRMAAIEEARTTQYDDPARIQALKSLISAPRVRLELRIAAFDELMMYDADATRTMLKYRLPSLPAADFLEHICERIVDEAWTEMTPSLVRSLGTETTIYEFKDRPERAALLALHPDQGLAEIVYEVATTPSSDPAVEHWRVMAWELLNLVEEPTNVRYYLQRATTEQRAADPLLDSLCAGASELNIVPRTREEIRWLQHLRDPSMASEWQRARDAVALVPRSHGSDLRLRDLAIVRYVAMHQPDWLELNMFDLMVILESRLSDGLTIFFNKSARSIPVDQSELLGDLRWGDMLAALLVSELMRDDAFVRDAFAQQELDFVDRTTEYGGIVDVVDRLAKIVPFEPRYREHDRKFIAPQSMMDRGYTGLFHYHLHAQDAHNEDYAGPGMGDLQYADALGANCIVFTSVETDALNVDYYCEGGMNLDLGVIRRGGSLSQ